MKSRKADQPLKGQWKLPLGAPRKHVVREERRKCGAPNCRTCTEGEGHGPYLYAVWREGTKVRRKYLAPTAVPSASTGYESPPRPLDPQLARRR